jgi:hypothetical protein
MASTADVANLIRSAPDIALRAIIRAAHDYAGNKIGSAGGGTVSQGAEGIVGRRFRGAGNGRFAPLSTSYATWKAKRFGKKPILVRTGTLRDSVVGHGRVRLLSGTLIEIIFTVPKYGKYHHDGEGDLPKRSPVEPNAQDIKAVQDSAARHYAFLIKAEAAKRNVTVK